MFNTTKFSTREVEEILGKKKNSLSRDLKKEERPDRYIKCANGEYFTNLYYITDCIHDLLNGFTIIEISKILTILKKQCNLSDLKSLKVDELIESIKNCCNRNYTIIDTIDAENKQLKTILKNIHNQTLDRF